MVIVGRVKIPFNDLFCLNRKELKAIIKGHEIDQRDFIEVVRKHALIGLEPHLRKGVNIDARKIWPLAWDTVEEAFKSTDEDRAKAKKLLEIAKRIKDGKSKNSG